MVWKKTWHAIREQQLTALTSTAPTVQSVKNGNWSDPTVWSSGSAPGENAIVNIPSGISIIYDTISSQNIGEIQVNGTLAFSHSSNTQLDVGSLLVLPTGKLEIGTESDPIPSNIKVTIRLVDLPDIAYTHLHGQVRLQPVIHTHGGTLDIHGAPIQNTWTTLTQDAPAGAATLTVKDSVGDWKVGDTIIVTGTNKIYVKGQTGELPNQNPITPLPSGCTIISSSPDCIDPAQFQVEEAIIASVSGATITLTAPLKNTHLGTFPRQAAVGLLSHNVVITSKDPAGRRGHVHISSGFSVTDATPLPNPIPSPVIGRISNAEFSNLGRSEPGVYPVHFHRLGNGGKDSYLKGSSITHTQNLCVRVHTTNFLTVENNVCYDALGHGYTTEDGTEVYNTFNHNLADRTQHNSTPTNPNDVNDDDEGSGFWMNNARNSVTNNYAADADAWGFQVDPITVGKTVVGPSTGVGPSPKLISIVDQQGNLQAPVPSTSLELLDFGNNKAYASYRGGAELLNLVGAGVNRVNDFQSTEVRIPLAAWATDLLLEKLYVDTVAFYSPGNTIAVALGRHRQVKFLGGTVKTKNLGYQESISVVF